ncbi:MAG: type I-E CRISPR-associated protein Cas6/Cse3/CasE [Thermomicrobiales bacterium]|nr:type I-E CRISPR-associated protein Cas6/Cse3/CasE [Thermomicrobiales bacterium]
MIATEKGQLYLSRLRLNPVSREVMRSLSNSQCMHALLMRGFPVGDRSEHNVLFRLDPVKGSREGLIDVIVQSTVEPDWAYLRREGMLLHESEFFGDGLVKNISSLPDRLQNGDVFRFRLRANPTKRIPWNVWASTFPKEASDKLARRERSSGVADPARMDGPRVPVTDLSLEKRQWVQAGNDLDEFRHPFSAEDLLFQWLEKQGQRCGFDIARPGVSPDPITGDMQTGWKSGDIQLSHKAMVFEGLLRVSDVEAFREALVHGIGPAKAYGFGLLSLAPAGGA